MRFGTTLTARGRRALWLIVAMAAVGALGAGAWLWLRDSGLARVRYVEITGITTSDGDRVRAALDEAARTMSTLHVREGALRDAVRTFPSVAAVRAHPDFPHRLTIEVVPQRPVAALEVDGAQRVPVTRSGVVLRGVAADRELPSVRLDRPALGTRLTDRRLLGALAVAGAAPGPLLARADEVGLEDRGVVVTMRDGPDLVFGNGADARAKWLAAARVLAEPSAAGATYLDLRIPGRVAAGGLAPVPTGTTNLNPQVEGQNGLTVNP